MSFTIVQPLAAEPSTDATGGRTWRTIAIVLKSVFPIGWLAEPFNISTTVEKFVEKTVLLMISFGNRSIWAA
jgi:hypothetical protein